MCEDCGHAPHAPGSCTFLYFYARGPSDPPGNMGCLCGHEFTVSSGGGTDGGVCVFGDIVIRILDPSGEDE